MFAPLRVHSCYSLLEGVSSAETLLDAAAACGYDNVALTDSNSLAGAVEFEEAARQRGIRPILGSSLRLNNQRVTALAAEPTGWRSLCRIISRIHLGKPSSLAALLAECHDGLHILTDDPFLMKPPLTDAFKGRLWAEKPPLTVHAAEH